jgi:hypothetical protein
VSYIEVGGRVVERDRGRGEKEGGMEKEKKEGGGNEEMGKGVGM